MAGGNGAGTLHEHIPDATRAGIHANESKDLCACLSTNSSVAVDAIVHPIQSLDSQVGIVS
jgi:hypothetical protein